ncbi:MAG: hypothetical protein ABIT01_18770, partial [Thermoanaerobaculia bacterium]
CFLGASLSRAQEPGSGDPPLTTPLVAEPSETGIVPRLNLYLPEGQADIRLSRLIKNSLFETQFEYDFVSGDIGAFLRYKYYGSRQSLSISGFDRISFRALETISNDFDRVRGFNVLLRRPITYQRRLSFLTELDRLSFSEQNADNNKTNIFVKVGYQLGTGDDSRSNQIAGDRNDRIRNLFTVFRDIGMNGRGLSVALTYGTPAGNFNYVKAEGEAIQIVDFPGNRRLIGRVHAGFFPYKPEGSPDTASDRKPYLIPGGELFRLDGREALKGSKTGLRGVNEIHFTLEAFYPVFINRNASFMKLNWNTLYAVGYIGTGSIGDEARIYTRLKDYQQDAGLGFEVAFSYRKYQVFVSGLVARVIQDSGSPKFLFTLRSVN